MKELQQIINQKVQSMIDENTIKEAIEKGIAHAINKAIESQFESYGSITKQLETAMKEGLRINTKDLPFETYNEQMLVAIKGKMGSLFHGQAAEKFMTEIDEFLAPAPKEMTIYELIENIINAWKKDDLDDLDEQASILIENKYGATSYSLDMWKKKESRSSYSSSGRSPDLQLYIIEGEIRISHRQHYNPTCFDECEAFIFKLYAAGTMITGIENFDEYECDLTLKDDEYY